MNQVQKITVAVQEFMGGRYLRVAPEGGESRSAVHVPFDIAGNPRSALMAEAARLRRMAEPLLRQAELMDLALAQLTPATPKQPAEITVCSQAFTQDQSGDAA